MKTEDLVSILATDTSPIDAHELRRRFVFALTVGGLGAVVVMNLLFGVRHDWLQAMGEWMLWVKLAFAACLALGGLMAVNRLGRPGTPLGMLWTALLTPVIVIWIASADVLIMADPAQRRALLLGDTSSSCPWNIALISLPWLIATFWAMKQLAPTQLSLAGASAGLLAGALATIVYALHCQESALPFVAIWYLLGIAIPTLLGSLLGPQLLRW